MRGAAFLSGIEDGVVVDVGGTTTDIGCLQAGFPREANNVVEVGGVRTLFRMPDLLSIGLGGGTEISADTLAIGPGSVGYRLTERRAGLRRRQSDRDRHRRRGRHRRHRRPRQGRGACRRRWSRRRSDGCAR